MIRKILTLLTLTIWLVYVVLGTFYLLDGNTNFEGFRTVKVVGEWASEIGEQMLLPGFVLGFIFGQALGGIGIFIGTIITYVIGRAIILKTSSLMDPVR
jgi:hypothetical protein